MTTVPKTTAVTFEPEPAPGPLKFPSMLTICLGTVLGAGIISYLPSAITAGGAIAGWMFPICVLIGLLYLAPFILASSALRLGGGTISLVGGLFRGKPLLIGIFALSTIFSPFSLSTYPVTLGNYVNAAFPAVSIKVVAFIAITAFYVINLCGVKFMSRAQNIMMPILAVGLAIFVVVGLMNITQPILDFSAPNMVTNGGKGIFSAWMLMNTCCISYYGLIFQGRNAANARRDIPGAILVTAAVIFVLYFGCGIVAIGVVPAEQLGGTLASVAAAIFPKWFYMTWMVCVPGLLTLTTMNGLISQFTMSWYQIARDGWFPEFMAKTKKDGTPVVVLTIIYCICLVPIFLGFNIATIVRYGQLFAFVGDIILAVLLFRLPIVFPEAWKKATLKVPVGVFYAVCLTSMGVKIAAFFNNLMNLSVQGIVITLGIVAAAICWAVYRNTTGKAKIKISCWGERAETSAVN